jgi:excisionase family DNA binding protein
MTLERKGEGSEPLDLLTIGEAAERMHMSERYVRRLVGERRIAFHRMGRCVRLRPADIDAFIAAGRVEPMDESEVWRNMRGVA